MSDGMKSGVSAH